MSSRITCPLCLYATHSPRYFDDHHADAVHTRCSCGWVGTKFLGHCTQRARYGDTLVHGIVERLPGPGPCDGGLTRAQLLAEVDVFKCELMVYADVDTADVERLRSEFYKAQGDRYRRSLLAMIEASKCTSEAMGLCFEADKEKYEHDRRH